MMGMARGIQVNDENLFSTWAPEPLKQEWDTEENAKRGFFMDKVALGGNQKVAWICADCGNHWDAKIVNRTSGGTGCPKCARVNDTNLFSICAPEPLKQEWDTEENAKRGFFMDNVALGGHQKVAWICAPLGCKDLQQNERWAWLS
jgi:hypothetical protein